MRNIEKQITYTGIQVETNERRKLASDLHDNVGPLLSSMNMYLSSLARKPEVQLYSDTITNIRRILKETIASVREISNNISPQVLHNYGLTDALNLFFESKKNLIPIKIENNMGDFRFSETKENMLYNIVKEAFNNSIKYANATLIELNIKKTENLITVIYKDNGIGFNLEEKLASASLSLGLFSIINRIKNLDGIYEINTSPGKGFMLEVNFLTDTKE
jgi:signal transduction histidine kinase